MNNEKIEAIYIRFSTSDFNEEECNYEEYFTQIDDINSINID